MGRHLLHGFAKRPHSPLHLQSKKSPLAIAKSYALQMFAKAVCGQFHPHHPQKSTLSGTTMAAAPLVFSIVFNIRHKVELFVCGCCPEILPVIGQVFRILCAISICDGHELFLPKGRVRKNIIIGSWCGHRQRVIATNQNLTR